MAAPTTPKATELRLLKRELFRHLGYEPHPGQVAVHRSKAPRRVLACGVRWGKSRCAAMEVVAALMAPAESSIGWVVAPTYDLCRRVVSQVKGTFESQLKHRVLATTEHQIVVRNLAGGVSEMRAKSADNPVSLLGEGLDWLVVDEAARLSRAIWDGHLAQRLVDKRGWALLLSTPRGRDWFYKMYRRAQKGRDPDYESWRSPSWENPYLDRATILAERARLPKEVFAQEFGGVFLGEELEPCDVCGGIREESCGTVVVWDGRPEEVPRCPECALMLDERGVPYGTRHEDKIWGPRMVVIYGEEADPPELPRDDELGVAR